MCHGKNVRRHGLTKKKIEGSDWTYNKKSRAFMYFILEFLHIDLRRPRYRTLLFFFVWEREKFIELGQ